MTDRSEAAAASAPLPDPLAHAPPVARGGWWRQGLRCAFLLRPDWRAPAPTPRLIAALVGAQILLVVLIERLYIVGPARFYWQAVLGGWLGTAVALWVCWLLASRARSEMAGDAPGAAALFAVLMVQAMVVTIVSALVFVPLVRLGGFDLPGIRSWARWAGWIALVAWYLAGQVVVLWRLARVRAGTRVAAMVLLGGVTVLQLLFRPANYWYPVRPEPTEADERGAFQLTQELLELQPRLLRERLEALREERPGRIDLYAITFAPYADEDVFMRESALVAAVMQERFDAAGRTIQLVNNPGTAREWPWATPANLHRAIRRIAQRMNREEDVLFIHLTSHGGKNARLATSFWPLQLDAVTPQLLRGWLDEAGVRNRVISVSACYAGSWIEPLAGPGTLVMTAADATHTSYGCGSGSPLTYFGRAMFDEALRRTWSFEEAHAAARLVIEQREQAAGKTDGYSNPQIRVGDAIRAPLARLQAQLQDRRE